MVCIVLYGSERLLDPSHSERRGMSEDKGRKELKKPKKVKHSYASYKTAE